MKVLYLIDSLEGYGAEKSIVQIALNMEEVIPVFIHLYDGDKLKYSLTKVGITVYSLNISSSYGYKEALGKIAPLIERENPDILHSTLFRSNMVARKLKKIFPDIPLVGSLVSNSYGKKRYSQMSFLSQLKLFTTQCRDRISARKVNYFICNSKAIMKTNVKALGIPEKKVKVIYRGRTFEDYKALPENLELLKNELNPGNNRIILNISRLIRSKGQLDLLHAFKKLLKHQPHNILYIAGEGPLRTELENKITSLKINKKVFLLGYREDVPALLALSDYFVFPSYYEGLPGALIEAIIAKRPSIVSDIPENRECFNENGALFFPPGDVQALSSKMEEAMKIADWEERLERSFSYAQKNFKVENISKKYEKFYRSILDEE